MILAIPAFALAAAAPAATVAGRDVAGAAAPPPCVYAYWSAAVDARDARRPADAETLARRGLSLGEQHRGDPGPDDCRT